MQSVTRFAGLWLFGTTVLLAMAGWLEYNGFLSGNTVQLWSKVILQMDGPVGYRTTDSLYPPLPFLCALILHSLIGTGSIAIPTLFASICGGLLAALIYQKLRDDADFSRIVAAILVLLTVFNPLFLYVVSDAPELASLCLGAWVFATGLSQLRRRGNAPDMMKVGLGLMIIGLSSAFGLLICLAAIPFMALVMPPRMLMTSPVGTILAVSFPVICAVGSLLIISAIFDTPLVAKQVATASQSTLVTILLIILIGGSGGLLSIVAGWKASTGKVALLAAFGTFASAVFLNLQIGYERDILKSAIPLLLLAPIAANEWRPRWWRGVGALTIFTVAWLANGALITQGDDRTLADWRSALLGEALPQREVAHVAAFLHGQTGVMLDAEAHPDLVVALAGISNLTVPGSSAFEAVALGGQPDIPLIVVKAAPDAEPTTDRLKRRFPEATSLTSYGYNLTFERGDWAVFALQDDNG